VYVFVHGLSKLLLMMMMMMMMMMTIFQGWKT